MIIMKKRIGSVSMICLCAWLLTACGQSFEADTNTVFVCKDGKVVSTDVENFDTGNYAEDGLKSYIDDAIAAYTGENGNDSVVLKDLAIEEGQATLILEYASAEDYAKFNEIDFYTGSVSDALKEGYSFDGDFASVADGKAVPCQINDYLGSEYKVVVFRGNANINVPGTVVCVSVRNTSYVDSATIAIQPGTHLLGESVDEENTQEATETVDGTEADSTQMDEGLLSDSDDDLLAAGNQDTEVVFDFDEEPENVEEPVKEFSQVYTYIIYK